MSIRLIAGRAGSGKTYACQRRLCEHLAQSIADGPRLVMLVPEQAALQMERGLLAMAGAPVLGRCEVLSFRRLAHRILNELAGPTPVVLSPNGRQAALRRLLGRRRGQWREFDRVADRPGFIAAVARGVTELLQEAATVDQLDEAARRAESEGEPSARRLHDLAVLYRDYLEYLGSTRVDPEGVLDLARLRLERSDWLSGAMIWVDGFAGLTRQQVRMLVSLAQQASQVELALLLDPAGESLWNGADAPDELGLFARMERMWHGVRHAMIDAGVAVDPPLLLSPGVFPRFAKSPWLARLERSLFAVSPAREPKEGKPALMPESARPADPAVRLVLTPDRRTEVQAAVKAMVDLVRLPAGGLRYRDIAIIVRDLEPYHDLLSAALTAHGIPYFMDRRRPTHPHALIRLLRGALAMHAPRGFGPAVLDVLKSGLTRVTDDESDELENYVLAYGLIDSTSWREPWAFSPRGGGDGDSLSRAESDALARLNGLRAAALELVGDWLPGAAGAHPKTATWLERLWSMLKRMEVGARLAAWRDAAAARGDHDTAAEHEQAWTSVVALLEELHEALGDDQMTARQFRECVEAGLSEFTLALAPSTLDQVLVSAIERSRHPPVRAVFLLGMSEADFPARISEDDVLGDEERASLAACGLELAMNSQRRALDERSLAYIALTRASERLWVSCPRSDEKGRTLQPSPFWEELRAALPEAVEESIEAFGAADLSTRKELAGAVAEQVRALCEQRLTPVDSESWRALYELARTDAALRDDAVRALSALRPVAVARLGSDAAGALWRTPYQTNVYAVETMAACPFRHFAARGLNLEKRAEHEIGALDLGRVYHTVMEEFVEGLRSEGRALGQLNTGEIAQRVSALCEQAISRYAEQIRMEAPQQKLATWRGRRELPAAVEGQRRTVGQTKLSPARLEQKFGLSNRAGEANRPEPLPALELTLKGGAKVLLRGVIDRIDLVQSPRGTVGVVYDYKRSTQAKQLALDELWHGLALQLAAYLLVLRDHGERIAGSRVVPGGAFYLPLLSPLTSVDSPDAESRKDPFRGFGPRGIIDFDWIAELDPELGTGRSSVFSVHISKDGDAGYVNSTDVVTSGSMEPLLEFVRDKMTELCEAWVAGEIAVSPCLLGTKSPCAHCDFGSVCRIEQIARASRRLLPMRREDVLHNLRGEPSAEAPDTAKPAPARKRRVKGGES